MTGTATTWVRTGLDHQRAGRLAEAEALYRQALGLEPRHPDALHLLAVVLHRQGRRDEARSAFERALAVKPDAAIVHYNHAVLLAELDDNDRAAEGFASAARHDPTLHAALYNLGLMRQRQGRLEEAATAYRQVLSQDPGQAPAWTNLGIALTDLGRPEEAVASLRRAAALDSASPEASSSLAQALRANGYAAEAVEWDLRAILLAPERRSLWQNLANALADGDCPGVTAAELTALLTRDDVDNRGAAMVACRRLAAAPDFRALEERDTPALADPLVLALLTNALVQDATVERVLTRTRRRLLLAGGGTLAFLVALAHQCFLNEYVWDETPEESAALAGADPGEDADRVALRAAYRPMPPTQRHLAGLETLIRRQVSQPADESRRTVPALTPLDDRSAPIRRQYEENPFPRWHVAPFQEPRPFGTVLRGLLPGVPRLPDSPAPEILIAGCGTGRQAVMCARRYKGARILAVDLSRNSLAYAMRQAEALGHGAIEFAQADILKLGSLDRRFDLIESFGVLHHLVDPAAGLAVLRDLLKPDGVMMLGLYSERARRDVVAVRARIAAMGGQSGDLPSIRRLRQDLLAESGAWPGICGPDGSFWTASDCRDLLFHVLEHRFTLPDIAALLDRLGLEFLGMEPDHPGDMQAFRRRFPEDPHGRSLSHWDAFETQFPRTFANTYRFWVRRR